MCGNAKKQPTNQKTPKPNKLGMWLSDGAALEEGINPKKQSFT